MKLISKPLAATFAAAVLSLGAAAAMAHGPAKAQHGGTVKAAHDMSFELVTNADGVTLYVDDHGKPKATAGATGKLTVLHGKDKTQADLKPAEGNALQAAGVKVAKGDTVVASVTFADKESATVRFKAP